MEALGEATSEPTRAEWGTGLEAGSWKLTDMCRNIKPLFNFEPPATDDEVRASALQFVRKVSGFTKPSKANEAGVQRRGRRSDRRGPQADRVARDDGGAERS